MTAQVVQVLVGTDTHSINIVGPVVYSNSLLTAVVAMPATVSQDTTWYVATRSARKTNPQGFAVTVTNVTTGGQWSRYQSDWVPGTIDCVAREIDLAVTGQDDASTWEPVGLSTATKAGLSGTYAQLSSLQETITYNTDGTVHTVTETVSGAVTTYTYNTDGTPATESRVLGGVTTLRTFSYTSGNLVTVS